MRKIIFRGMTEETKKWREGNLSIHQGNGNCYITTQSQTGGAHPWKVKPGTVGQYTGRKDSKGQMIFEDDILHIEIRDFNTGKVICSANEAVIYNGDGFGVIWGHHRDFSYLSTFSEQFCTFEVIGNVHQNPELLRAEEATPCRP